MRDSRLPSGHRKDENELNINDEIRAPKVRLVGDNIPEPGIYPISAAMKMADEMELDLVEITAKADPPVCKILDYQKYLYQQKKKAKEKEKPVLDAFWTWLSQQTPKKGTRFEKAVNYAQNQ